MIDLNAHVPKPPQKISRQRATLSLSRCSYTPPILMKLTVECVPSSTPPEKPSVSISPAAHSVSAKRPAREDDANVVVKLRATCASLSSENDLLKDENSTLRNAVSAAKSEASHTYTAVKTATGPDLQRLLDDLSSSRSELQIHQRTVATLKEQLKNSLSREEELGFEVQHLLDAKRKVEETVNSLERENGSLRRQVSIGRPNDNDSGLRNDILGVSQQQIRDLRQALSLSDSENISLKDQLRDAKQIAQGVEERLRTETQRLQSRSENAENRALQADGNLRQSQIETQSLREYASKAQILYDDAVKKLEVATIRLKRRNKDVADLKALIHANIIAGVPSTKDWKLEPSLV